MTKNKARSQRDWPQKYVDPERDYVTGQALEAPWRGMLSIEPREREAPISCGPQHNVMQFDLGRTPRYR